MTSIGSPSPFFFGGKKAYAVDRSLRFNDDDDTYLQRTVSSTSNRKTFTISAWIKPSRTDSRFFFGVTDTSGYEFFYIGIDSFYRLVIFDYDYPVQNVGLTTNRLFRDPSAWYHIVVAFDTTQATNTDRVKLYVNGVQEASWYNEAYPAQNLDTFVNHTTFPVYIGKLGWGGGKYDGYMAEYNFIDGLQLTPSSFGETDAITGQWNPIKYVGSYGTNGFYLNFLDNSGTTATTLGKDSSGNGNNFTPNNFSVAAGAGNDSLEDTPTNNFCTLNPITYGSGGGEPSATLSNGNLDFTESSSNNRTAVSTFGLKTGKWYFELLSTNTGTFSIGWHDFENNQGSFYRNNGSYSSSFGGGGTFGYSSWTTSDVIGVAIDFDSGKIWYAKNNTWQSGDPATGNSPTNTFTTGRTLHTEAFTDNSSGTKSGSFNYGQRPFTYTPPTGYKSMCSANLPDPTILLPNKHFGTLLWTGNATVRTISDTSIVNFTPDWVWVKSRSSGDDHQLTDSVRGSSKALKSNATEAEIDWDVAYSGNNKGMGDYVNGGFILDDNGNNQRYNRNSATFVAWNWNAGNTDGKTYAVTVVSDSGNKYRFDGFGTSAVTLDLAEGGTYIFDQSDSSNAGHPLRFYTAADKTGGEYTTGVTTAGTPGQSGAYTQIVVAASAPTLFYQCSVHAGMGGQANTNSTLGSSNFDGTIQSTVKVNASAGFSIVSFTGNATSGATVGHGLGVAPRSFILKERGNTNNWPVYHAEIGNTKTLYLDLNNDSGGAFTGAWNNTSPTSNVFYLGNSNETNRSSGNFIVYCFTEVTGYSKFGKYTGNGSADGTFVFTGFRPAFVLIKSSSNTENWYIIDNKRPEYNGALGSSGIMKWLKANTGDSESQNGLYNFLSNGFKLGYPGADTNGSGRTYVYFAFAESPFKNARAR